MTTQLENGETITYVMPDELHSNKISNDLKTKYLGIYSLTNNICKDLHIRIPYIGLTDKLYRSIPETTRTVVYGGATFLTSIFPSLDNTVVILSLEDESPETITARLAHELRHVWQDSHPHEITHAETPLEAMFDISEVDADGYAMKYISKHMGITLEEAVDIVYPVRSQEYFEAALTRFIWARLIN